MKLRSATIIQFLFILIVGFVIGVKSIQKLQVDNLVLQNEKIVEELNKFSNRELEIQKLESSLLPNQTFLTNINVLEDSILFLVVPNSICHECMTTVYREISRQASLLSIEVRVVSSFEKFRTNKSFFQDYNLEVQPIPEIPEDISKCFMFRKIHNHVINFFTIDKNQAKSIIRYFTCLGK